LELIDQWLYPCFPLLTATEVSPELFLVLNIISSSSSFIKSVKSLITSPQKDNLCCCCLSKQQLQDKWHGISCHATISVEQ